MGSALFFLKIDFSYEKKKTCKTWVSLCYAVTIIYVKKHFDQYGPSSGQRPSPVSDHLILTLIFLVVAYGRFVCIVFL